ncbi:DUF1722 domain-containing protein [Candidatus Binatus sp.]|uniref:DUF1722 domain-containing protein n=1 Tax=Candidatus Binatus sp. TaxID=2811406 RepID=UPI0039C88997
MRDDYELAFMDYRRGLVPLVVSITLFRHYVRECEITYLQGQVYLEPHPKELMLRNHVQLVSISPKNSRRSEWRLAKDGGHIYCLPSWEKAESHRCHRQSRYRAV